MSPRLAALRRWTRRVETAVVAALALAMIVLAGAQIVLRNFFDTGFVWADPLLRALVLWTAILGALAAAGDDKHIGLDLLTHYLHGRAKRVAGAVALLFGAVVSALMAWASVGLVQLDYGSGTRAFANVPNWCVELILPVGFALLALRLAVHALRPEQRARPALAPDLP